MGIRLVRWFMSKCRDPTEGEERNEVEDEKLQGGYSSRSTPPYATFGFINGDYQIIYYPGYTLPKESEHGQIVNTPYVPVSPAPTLSPGRRSIYGD